METDKYRLEGRVGLLGIVLPAAAVLTVTIVAAVEKRLQGLLITGTGLVFFIVAMMLIPRLKPAEPSPAKAKISKPSAPTTESA